MEISHRDGMQKAFAELVYWLCLGNTKVVSIALYIIEQILQALYPL